MDIIVSCRTFIYSIRRWSAHHTHDSVITHSTVNESVDWLSFDIPASIEPNAAVFDPVFYNVRFETFHFFAFCTQNLSVKLSANLITHSSTHCTSGEWYVNSSSVQVKFPIETKHLNWIEFNATDCGLELPLIISNDWWLRCWHSVLPFQPQFVKIFWSIERAKLLGVKPRHRTTRAEREWKTQILWKISDFRDFVVVWCWGTVTVNGDIFASCATLCCERNCPINSQLRNEYESIKYTCLCDIISYHYEGDVACRSKNYYLLLMSPITSKFVAPHRVRCRDSHAAHAHSNYYNLIAAKHYEKNNNAPLFQCCRASQTCPVFFFARKIFAFFFAVNAFMNERREF